MTDLIKEARRLSKKIKNEGWATDIRIAVLGSTSIQQFVLVLRYMLYIEGINADIYEGEYNGITMDVFDDNSNLYKFNPNIVILNTHYLDIKELPLPLDNKEEVDNLLDKSFNYYKNVWERLNKIKDVVILQTNFAYPPEHLLSNLENSSIYSRTNFYKRLNDKLANESLNNVTIIDVELLSEYVGKYNYFDYSAYFLTKSAFNVNYLEDYTKLFVDQIKAIKGKTKKCIVLDLDNTLWGGVVGDEGYDGIQLDPNNAVGEAYRYFQQYLLDLKQRGIILAVCSKNDEENAKEPFIKNPNMILKLDDIACFKANWQDKASNIKAIAKELNIGTDSLVFFDDNPAERQIVKQFLPEVHVVDVPEDPALYVEELDKESPFEWLQITKEDLTRNNSYIQNRNRQQLEQTFVNYEDYLKALDMSGTCKQISDKDVSRFTQLLNKSNQFNLRTQRYTESEIQERVNDFNYKCLAVNLKDKFSEYGIISCIILKKENETCFIESWVMSCRVLKRGVEDFAFNHVYKIAKDWGCDQLLSEYIPTAKNKMVEEFYDNLGFSLIKQEENKEYQLPLNKLIDKVNYIKDLDNE